MAATVVIFGVSQPPPLPTTEAPALGCPPLYPLPRASPWTRTSAILCPQLGVKALTYNDLIQAQKEISAHNQQLREQTEQLEKDNQELRSQSLQLVRGAWAGAGRAVVCSRVPQSAPEHAGLLHPRPEGPGIPRPMGLEPGALICVPRQRWPEGACWAWAVLRLVCSGGGEVPGPPAPSPCPRSCSEHSWLSEHVRATGSF